MGWDWYERPAKRRPADGIKAQSKKFGQTWWAGRWLAALEQLVDMGRLSRGRSYARSGQVLNLDIASGLVKARVQGSRPSPYRVKIEIKPLSAKAWDKAADAMAAQALFAAKLLAGEMPNDIEKAFTQAGASLFPSTQGDLHTECSCPDMANPCKHIAAVYYLLGEQFDADPFLVFRLRGKDKAEIMEMLRARRSAALPEAAAPARRLREKVERPAQTSEPVASLEACLTHFWEPAASLDDLHTAIVAPEVEAGPVKRLGPPSFWHDNKVDFMALLSRAYQSVTRASLNLALRENDDQARRPR